MVPRSSLGAFEPSERDVVAIIRESNRGRLAQLIPLRMERMSASPFSFYRGAARVMAFDLAFQPVTGIQTQICGDAHLQNLGAFATHHGALIFDINDFDETISGPWEWDLKRLAASIVLAGREAGHTDQACRLAVRSMAGRYQKLVRAISRMPVVSLSDFSLVRTGGPKPVRRLLEKARQKSPENQMSKRTELNDLGIPRLRELELQTPVPEALASRVIGSLGRYRETLPLNSQAIFDAYHPSDVAFKVVGTGSVGTRDYIVLLFGNGIGDPLFLQVKEAVASCYEPYLDYLHASDNHGKRVAEGQQKMQMVTDPFLGWTTIEDRHFLVRRLADQKSSIDPLGLRGDGLASYGIICGDALAKAHARNGGGTRLAGYLGTSPKFGRALARFATAYADQVEKDFDCFKAALNRGELPS